jgi:hypothetical protein
MTTELNSNKAKDSGIHPLLETLLHEAFRYEADKGLNPQSAVSMALKIASDAEKMLSAIGELHFEQIQRLEEHRNPEENTVQHSILNVASKLRMIKELLFYASCSESDYAALMEYDKTIKDRTT